MRSDPFLSFGVAPSCGAPGYRPIAFFSPPKHSYIFAQGKHKVSDRTLYCSRAIVLATIVTNGVRLH